MLPVAATADAGWAIVSSPNASITGSSQLNGVTCVSASDCWAVGWYNDDTGGGKHTLIEQNTGNGWAIVSSPDASSSEINQLNGVACADASHCWAVGSYGNDPYGHTLIEQNTGSGWAIVSSPDVGGTFQNVLDGVTCVSATDCWAVGSDLVNILFPIPPTGPAGHTQTLVEHYTASGWAIVSSPDNHGLGSPSAQENNLLKGVTCVSASDCWAVGRYFNPDVGIYETLIEQYTGTGWAIVSSPNNLVGPGTSSTAANNLAGVSCADATHCWAVGDYSNNGGFTQTLIEQYDGNLWTIVVISPNSTSGTSTLTGVTCVSASDCWAVGQYTDNNGAHTLTEQYTGSAWAIVGSPNVGVLNLLQGVTCVSASDCWAVGSGGGNPTVSLAEQNAGSGWTIVSTPTTSTHPAQQLTGVTCVVATDCWAVGYTSPAYTGTHQTLIEHYDGSAWAVVSSPNATQSINGSNQLNGVTCVSASDCWAVGWFSSGNNQTLIEHYNGSGWAIDSTLTQVGQLQGVTCVNASDCWAVGISGSQTLIEQFTGSAWTSVSSPNASSTRSNELNGVTCVSASDCWAVGWYVDNNGEYTLIERNTGSGWAIVSSPNGSASGSNQYNQLTGTTCVSASDCWAVGWHGYPAQTLIEQNTGSGWAIVTSPNAGPSPNILDGVTCVSASDCWAVGEYDDNNGAHTLIEQYSGSAWAIVGSPSVASNSIRHGTFNLLEGVTCVSASDCWAVGKGGPFPFTLVEQYSLSGPVVPESPVGPLGLGITSAVIVFVHVVRRTRRRTRSGEQSA
jgi:hypothetical protein